MEFMDSVLLGYQRKDCRSKCRKAILSARSFAQGMEEEVEGDEEWEDFREPETEQHEDDYLQSTVNLLPIS